MYVLLEFWQKNHGDPYYEPTIVVHDKIFKQGIGIAEKSQENKKGLLGW